MVRLAACVLGALLATVVLTRRPILVPLLAMTIWVLVPGIAAPLVTGAARGPAALHPAAVTVLVGVAAAAVQRPRQLRAALEHRPEWSVLLGFVLVVAVTIGVATGLGTPSAVEGMNQVVAPVLLFLLLGAALLERPEDVELLARWFVTVAVLQSALATVQLTLGTPLVYTAQYEEQEFYQQNLNRWMGTLDHPLVLSFFLVVSMFFLAALRNWLAIVVCGAAMFGGVLVTQSRTGVVIALAAMVYVTVTARLPSPALRPLLLVALLAGGTVAVSTGLTDALSARLADDTGSTRARIEALAYFVGHVEEFLWLGRGVNASFNVSDAAGLGTSFESSVLMYAVDLGLVAALLYFGVMVAVTIRSWGVAVVPGATGAAVAVLLVPQTFSALSGLTAAPMIVWATLAAAAFGAVRARRPLPVLPARVTEPREPARALGVSPARHRG